MYFVMLMLRIVWGNLGGHWRHLQPALLRVGEGHWLHTSWSRPCDWSAESERLRVRSPNRVSKCGPQVINRPPSGGAVRGERNDRPGAD